MKKVLFFLLLVLSSQLYGQNFVKNYINDIGDKKEDALVVSISGKMLQFASMMSKDADKDFKELVKNIDQINLVVDLELNDEEKEHLKKLCGMYDELMSVTDKGQKVDMYIREKNKKVQELIVCVEENNRTTLIDILGDIDLRQLSKLSSGLNIKGMEHLDKVKEGKKSKSYKK